MKLLILVLVNLSLFCGEWVEKTGQVASESYTVAFPGEVQTKEGTQEMTLYHRDKDTALYLLSTNTPPLIHAPAEAVKKLLNHHNQPPKSVLAHSVTTKGAHTILDLEAVHAKTHVKTKIRYVITPHNVWQLKTAYQDKEDHERFVASFDIKDL
jgi:hypothetical protein